MLIFIDAKERVFHLKLVFNILNVFKKLFKQAFSLDVVVFYYKRFSTVSKVDLRLAPLSGLYLEMPIHI